MNNAKPATCARVRARACACALFESHVGRNSSAQLRIREKQRPRMSPRGRECKAPAREAAEDKENGEERERERGTTPTGTNAAQFRAQMTQQRKLSHCALTQAHTGLEYSELEDGPH
ncbi:unnamed protein product [Lampetra fluviatilis]